MKEIWDILKKHCNFPGFWQQRRIAVRWMLDVNRTCSEFVYYFIQSLQPCIQKTWDLAYKRHCIQLPHGFLVWWLWTMNQRYAIYNYWLVYSPTFNIKDQGKPYVISDNCGKTNFKENTWNIAYYSPKYVQKMSLRDFKEKHSKDR